MSRATIVDVAAAAAVSIKTVSRVINGEPNVRPETRARIEAAIQKLGFTPNTAARSLAGNKSFLLGTIFDNPSSSYIVELLRGAMTACREAGYHLTIEEIDISAPDVAVQMERMLSTSRMDGIILSPPVTDCAAVLDAIEASKLPYVLLTPANVSRQSHSIYVDDKAATAEIAKYLWDLGHRSFAVVKGPETHGSSKLRFDGFVAGIVARGGRSRQIQVVQGDFSFRSGMSAGHKLLSGKKRPTAIFASNDDMAAGIFSMAGQLGLRIPEDISVVGYDDSAIAELVWPSLTTIRQPIADMAAEAARLLIQKQSATARCIQMAYKLVIRQSTGIVKRPS